MPSVGTFSGDSRRAYTYLSSTVKCNKKRLFWIHACTENVIFIIYTKTILNVFINAFKQYDMCFCYSSLKQENMYYKYCDLYTI